MVADNRSASQSQEIKLAPDDKVLIVGLKSALSGRSLAEQLTECRRARCGRGVARIFYPSE